ncbi:unnamed protein product [Ascophyllum nodosum]
MISRAEVLRAPPKSTEPQVFDPLTSAQKKEVDEAFAIFDYASTGTLNLYEVKVLMRSLGFSVERAEVPVMVHRANPDCDGEVDLPTFRRIMQEKYAKLDPEEQIKKAFTLFDSDGLGKITVEDLRRVSKELGENLGDRELEAMIEVFDNNLDGSVNLEGFARIMGKQRDLGS